MTLIDGDRIVTAQLYDDEYEKFTEKKMSIIDFINAFTDEGVITADDVLDKIRAEIAEYGSIWVQYQISGRSDEDIKQLVSGVLKQAKEQVLEIIDKYKAESKSQKSEAEE